MMRTTATTSEDRHSHKSGGGSSNSGGGSSSHDHHSHNNISNSSKMRSKREAKRSAHEDGRPPQSILVELTDHLKPPHFDKVRERKRHRNIHTHTHPQFVAWSATLVAGLQDAWVSVLVYVQPFISFIH
jgi:hypothetical protein